LKIEKSRYLQNRLADFNEILPMTHNTHPELASCLKIQILQNPKWQINRHFESH